ncbi:uncharacterized protein Dwil_GK20756 [Drosophila willistoni]|uniref:Serpin domain-containing protein n=1 Tax=Drosophila willistoni TaxID=7260 RepID=A0A0Q9WYR8_DROWI|nr:uncharacterized protein Dwil_GK20756 [Drosophila willistoni]
MDNTSRKVAYTPPPGDFSGDLEKFSNYLYNQLSTGNPNRNIIFSPFCIQTCAAMLLMGAEKGTETFGELRYGLQFSSENYLDATALQMDYKDSDLSMLIVLPNTRTGLRHVENKLQSTSLKKITNLLTETPVDVKIPKFKAEFEQELSPVFQVLGIKRIFSNDAELGKIITTDDPVNVSQILHKAYIEVNELGSEAAAATAMIVMVRSMPLPPPKPKQFYANKQFYYTIFHRSHGHLFAGNVVTQFSAPAVPSDESCSCEKN